MNVIEVSNVTKKYNETVVVHSVSFAVKKGEIYGLLGRNGAGKTTIMKMLLGLAKPTEGRACILGSDTNAAVGRNILRKVGCVIENPGFYANLTGTENLTIFARLKALDDTAVQKALALVNLPYNDKKLFSKYSLGMKQRLAIANAVMHNPEVLILDEPINGLDPIGIAEVRKLLIDLKQSGVSILISSHILSEVENLADRIGIINDGKLIEEVEVSGIIKERITLEDYFKKVTGGQGIG